MTLIVFKNNILFLWLNLQFVEEYILDMFTQLSPRYYK